MPIPEASGCNIKFARLRFMHLLFEPGNGITLLKPYGERERASWFLKGKPKCYSQKKWEFMLDIKNNQHRNLIAHPIYKNLQLILCHYTTDMQMKMYSQLLYKETIQIHVSKCTQH